jgi:hypothetical protein
LYFCYFEILVITFFSEDGRKPRKILVKTDRVTIDVTPDIIRNQKTGKQKKLHEPIMIWTAVPELYMTARTAQ